MVNQYYTYICHNTVQEITYLCNYKETMRRNSSLSIPLSLVFMSPKPKLNFNLVINDYNYPTKTKVCKDVPIVVPPGVLCMTMCARYSLWLETIFYQDLEREDFFPGSGIPSKTSFTSLVIL